MSAAEQRHYCPVCSAVFRTPYARCPLDGNELAELEGDPLVGTTLDGRYVIEQCIGEGGMGRVYRAKHTRMSRTYAIKILFGDHAGDTRMRSRFAREAEAVSRVNHANVISVVDFGETAGGLLYLVMDLADGESLAELMIREAPMAPERAVALLAKLAKGLGHAHAQGLVHRDFKGENVIMVQEEEQEVPKIVDFGICMIIEDSPSSTLLTSNGMVMGTPAVMAPEQASGDKVDHRTDLFSLGIVGYQMLSGCLPFEGTPLDMARKNLYEPIPAIRERSGVVVPQALEAVITKLTAKRPEERYQSAKEALIDLQSLGWVEPGSDWSAPTPMPTPRPASLADHGHVSLTGTTPGQISAGLGVASTTPMTTQMVGSSEYHSLEPNRARKVPIIIGLVAVAAVAAAAIALSGGDAQKPETVATAQGAALTEPSNESQANTETTTDTEPEGAGEGPKPGTDTTASGTGVTPTTGDPTGELPKDVEPAVEPVEVTPVKTPKKPVRKTSNRRKNSGKKNRQHKTTDDKPKKPAVTVQETKQLYSAVGAALDRLESSKGKTAVVGLRRDYNSISFSRLLRDSTYQPVYHQMLLRLRNKIRAMRKK